MTDIVAQLLSEFDPSIIKHGDDIKNRASSYWDATPQKAKALIKPRNTEELSKILKKCNEEKQIIVTHGGLTGCAKAADTTDNHIIISTENMNSIVEIDEVGGTITVEAGAILETVQEKVAEKGFYFPLDLGARGSCTIGGNAATNAGGINVIRYGMMRNHILGMETVLADGTIISSMNKVIKNNAGYDLKHLFIGSEGTLGIITRLIVKLEALPNNQQTALIGLNDFSDVTNFLNHMKKNAGSQLTAYEVMWGDYFERINSENNFRSPIESEHNFYVITECSGANPDADKEAFMDILSSAFEENIIHDAVIAQSEREKKDIWAAREGFEPLLKFKPIFLYDVSLPIRNMETYTKKVKQDISDKWPNADCYVIGHIGDGNLHLFICPNQDPNEDEVYLHDQSDEIVYAPLKKIGGSVSAEHGIGNEKKKWLSYSRSEEEIALMKNLKTTLDPNNILNPGVIF